MDLVRFRHFLDSDFPVYADWFLDENVARRVSFPDADWLAHLNVGDGVIAEVATLGAEATPAAILQYDVESDGGISLLLTVDPALQGRGIGRRVLTTFIEKLDRRFTYIDAYAEQDNVAAIALARRCGFRLRGGPDEEGFLPYRRDLTA